jgi:hypothetical protein
MVQAGHGRTELAEAAAKQDLRMDAGLRGSLWLSTVDGLVTRTPTCSCCPGWGTGTAPADTVERRTGRPFRLASLRDRPVG